MTAFDTLDATIPLALLPVRLEARYLPPDEPRHLVVRILPDTIHADGHDPLLTAREQDAGRTYWQRIWEADGDASAQAQARAWLAGIVGAHRAVYVAEQTTPLNRDEQGPKARPRFATLEETTAPRAMMARLLPAQWVVRLYDDTGQLRYEGLTEPRRDELPMAPSLPAEDLEALATRRGDDADLLGAFLDAQGLAWVADLDTAERLGMVHRIPIGQVPDPVGALMVAGVVDGDDPKATAAAFDAHLAVQHYTDGIDVVAQGTPTNATELGPAGLAIDAPDVDGLFEDRTRPLAPVGRAALISRSPASLYALPAADALSLAFGRLRPSAWDRCEGADNLDALAGRAMNLAVGYATIGGYLDGPLRYWRGAPALAGITAELRTFFRDWVRGGALLPTFRCGPQPYGVLPITSPPTVQWAPGPFETKLEHHLSRLLDVWRASLPSATLDPDATDGLPGADPSASTISLAEVLGAVPHPTGLRLRTGVDHSGPDAARFGDIIDRLRTLLTGPAASSHHLSQTGVTVVPAQFFRARLPLIDGVPTSEVPNASVPDVFAQLMHVQVLRSEITNIPTFASGTSGQEALSIIDEELVPLLELYREVMMGMPAAYGDINFAGGLGTRTAVHGVRRLRLIATTFAHHTEPVELLVTATDDLSDLAEMLSRVHRALSGKPPRLDERVGMLGTNAPLLLHLLDQTWLRVPPGQEGEVVAALGVLMAGLGTPAGDRSGFERLLRETLGLSMHRIDAWVTGLAARRLAELRAKQPAGVQVGGYGWLLDLRRSPDATSQGFVHAPSMDHATTAAVLRAGWNAFGTDQATAPLAVDLSSQRMRGARWILDGVRNGQDLAELLGARFERFLHDAELDVWIDTIRQAVAEALGRPGTPPVVVDGLVLARAASGLDPATMTDAEVAVQQAVMDVLRPTGDRAQDRIRQQVGDQLERLAADLDAVADVTMAQAVHALLKGNTDASGAALAATGQSDAAVPEITVSASQQRSVRVTHRVVLGWDADTGQHQPVDLGVAGLAEPRLARWLVAHLPDPGEVGWASRRGSDGSGRRRGTLGELGLNALEVALLAAGTATQSTARLGRTVSAVVAAGGGPVPIDTADAAGHRFSIDEVGLIAHDLLEAAGRGRALQAADLTAESALDPAVSDGTVDVAELAARVTEVEAALRGLVRQLTADDPTTLTSALVTGVVLQVPGALDALEALGDLSAPSDESGGGQRADELVTGVVAALQRRLSGDQPPAGPDGRMADGARGAAGGRQPPDPKAWTRTAPLPLTSDDDTHPHTPEDHLGRLRQLTGWSAPILPVVTLPPDADRTASLSDKPLQREVADHGHRWLSTVGMVRDTVESLVLAGHLTAAADRDPFGQLTAVQLPADGTGWAARGPSEVDRTCILSLTGPRWLEAERVAGLLIDGWSEGIPLRQRQTGIAVHFDAPTARPPSAVLLSVVPADRSYSTDEVFDQLRHVIDLAKIRTVGPDRLVEFGQAMPAVYLPDGRSALAEEASS